MWYLTAVYCLLINSVYQCFFHNVIAILNRMINNTHKFAVWSVSIFCQLFIMFDIHVLESNSFINLWNYYVCRTSSERWLMVQKSWKSECFLDDIIWVEKILISSTNLPTCITKTPNAIVICVNQYIFDILSSFLTWKRPEDTRQLFIPLCVAAVMSIFLKLDTMMFVFGM